MHNFALVGLVLVPLVGSLVLFAMPKQDAKLAKLVALLFSLATLVYTIVIAVRFDTEGPRFQFVGSWTWIRSLGVHLSFGVDGIALVLIGMSVILVPTVILAS